MMGGRQQVFMFLGLIVFLCGSAVAARNEAQELSNALYERCREVAGKEAADDFMDSLDSFLNCINFKQMYGEAQQHFMLNDVKGGLETFCRKKELFLTCARKELENVKRCLLPQEMKSVETEESVLEAAGNFFCKNLDDIAKISQPQEIACAKHLGKWMENCAKQVLEIDDGNIYSIDFSKLLLSKEDMCQKTEETLNCMNESLEKCKDSASLRLVNSFIKDVLDNICSNSAGASGVAGLLAFADTLPGVLVHLVLGLTASFVLNLL